MINEVNDSDCEKYFEDMIGNGKQFDGPIKDDSGRLTKKMIIPNDFTSSGMSSKTIENYIQKKVLPNYSNNNSKWGYNAEKNSKLYQESKEILREYTNAYGNYSIIYQGQGSTDAVSKLIKLLNIKKYVDFYNDSKMAFELNEEDENIDKLKEKISEQFKELFINTNFCYKYKEKERQIYKCVLCKEELINEGDYYKHIKEEEHKKHLEEYKNNQNDALFEMHEEPIKDFIDIIKEKYSIDNVLDIINDYEKFKPVILISVYEHNSNSLIWKETGAEIVMIKTHYDMFYEKLEEELNKYKDNYIKICSFTASSNITGLLLDIDKISLLMHEVNGYAFFDYSTAAPYFKIDLIKPLPDNYRESLKFDPLNEEEKIKVYKDGLFFSPHNFIGGPDTPGVLIVHDRIHRNQLKPTQPGGGTVNFVYKDIIDYSYDIERREESGTPNIIGSIRLGLTISLRQKIPHDLIIKRNEHYINLFLDKLETIPNLYILQNYVLNNIPHIPIFSLMISFGNKFYHPNYICALLNDLFGIQCTPGDSCAPNYGLDLLGFDKDKTKFELLKEAIREGNEIFKPGFLRLNLPYFYPEYVIKYTINAIKFICENAHKFLGMYYYDIKTGRFYHYRYKGKEIESSLKSFDINYELPENEEEKKISPEELDKVFQEVEHFTKKKTYFEKTFIIINGQEVKSMRQDYQIFYGMENLRWFCVYKDVEELLNKEYTYKLSFKKEDDPEYKKLNETIEEIIRKRNRNWVIKN